MKIENNVSKLWKAISMKLYQKLLHKKKKNSYLLYKLKTFRKLTKLNGIKVEKKDHHRNNEIKIYYSE